MAATLYTLFFGSGNAGQAPTFSTFVNDDTGAALPQPAISDIGGGFYRFPVDWSTVAATNIRYAAGPVNGVEVDDTITSNPAPGTVTPAPRSQNLALFPTAQTVLQRAGLQCGLTPAADPYASTDPNWILLRELLVSLGDDLLQAADWTHMVQPCTFVTDGATSSYMLPKDFHELVDDTLWNRTTRLPGAGPLSQQQVAALQARLANVVLYYTYQVVGGLLVSPTVPPAGSTIAFAYVSTYWAQSGTAGAPDKDRPSANDDIVLFDEELLILGLKLRYDEARGFDTARTQERYDAKLEHCIGKNDPGPTLTLGGERRQVFDRPIDGWNVPPGNWGT